MIDLAYMGIHTSLILMNICIIMYILNNLMVDYLDKGTKDDRLPANKKGSERVSEVSRNKGK